MGIFSRRPSEEEIKAFGKSGRGSARAAEAWAKGKPESEFAARKKAAKKAARKAAN